MTENHNIFVSSSSNFPGKQTFLFLFFFSPRLIFVRVRFVDRQSDRRLIVVVVEHRSLSRIENENRGKSGAAEENEDAAIGRWTNQ